MRNTTQHYLKLLGLFCLLLSFRAQAGFLDFWRDDLSEAYAQAKAFEKKAPQPKTPLNLLQVGSSLVFTKNVSNLIPQTNLIALHGVKPSDSQSYFIHECYLNLQENAQTQSSVIWPISEGSELKVKSVVQENSDRDCEGHQCQLREDGSVVNHDWTNSVKKITYNTKIYFEKNSLSIDFLELKKTAAISAQNENANQFKDVNAIEDLMDYHCGNHLSLK